MVEAEEFKTGVCPIPVPMKEYRWLRLDFTATDGKQELEEKDTQRLPTVLVASSMQNVGLEQ